MTRLELTDAWLDQHRAPHHFRRWVAALPSRELECVWSCHDMAPQWRVWLATRPGVLDARTLRLFALFCARQVAHLVSEAAYRDVADSVERVARSEPHDAQLETLRRETYRRAYVLYRAVRALEAAAHVSVRCGAEQAADDAAWALGLAHYETLGEHLADAAKKQATYLCELVAQQEAQQ